MSDINPEWVEAGAQADYDHDPDRMNCLDHDGRCCPSLDAHNMGARESRDHRAAAVIAAVAPLIVTDERVIDLPCGCSHVLWAGGRLDSTMCDRHTNGVDV